MKKEWFVIRSDHHEGPYTVTELDSLFSKRKIEKSSSVWKEGLSDPISFKNFLESFADARSKSYESPFVQTKVNFIEQKVTKPVEEVQLADKEINASSDKVENIIINTKEVDPEPPVVIEFADEEIAQPAISEVEYIEETVAKSSGFLVALFNKLTFVAFATFLVVLAYVLVRVGTEYYEINNTTFEKPKLMKRNDYKRMVTSLLDEKKSNFSVSKDASILWMAFDSVYDGKLEIKLVSSSENNLNLQDLTITGSGSFKNRLASFKRLNFEGSDKIVPGVYDIEIKNLTNNYNGFWLSSFFSLGKIKKLSFEKVFLGNMKQTFFENKLKREKFKKSKFHQNFMLEIEQRKKTLKAILAQIDGEVRDIIKNSGKRKALRLMRDFKTKYIKTYGYFFSMFVKENQDFFNKVVKTTFKNKEQIISGFNNLAKIAKSSAQNCSEIMEMFKGSSKLSIKQTIRLEKEILNKFNIYQQNL